MVIKEIAKIYRRTIGRAGRIIPHVGSGFQLSGPTSNYQLYSDTSEDPVASTQTFVHMYVGRITLTQPGQTLDLFLNPQTGETSTLDQTSDSEVVAFTGATSAAQFSFVGYKVPYGITVEI